MRQMTGAGIKERMISNAILTDANLTLVALVTDQPRYISLCYGPALYHKFSSAENTTCEVPAKMGRSVSRWRSAR